MRAALLIVGSLLVYLLAGSVCAGPSTEIAQAGQGGSDCFASKTCILSRLQVMVDSMPPGPASGMAQAKIAVSLQSLARNPLVEGLFVRATSMAKSTRPPDIRAFALADVAEAAATAGEPAIAVTTYAAAMEAARTVSSDEGKVFALAGISASQSRSRFFFAAKSTLEEALRIQGDDIARTLGATLLAVAHAQATAELFDDAMKTVRAMTGPEIRDLALPAIVYAQTRAGHLQAARNTAQDWIVGENARASAFVRMAAALVDAGQISEVESALRTAERIIPRIPSAPNRVEILVKMSEVQRKAALVSEAKSNLRAAQALLVQSNSTSVAQLVMVANEHSMMGQVEEARQIVAMAKSWARGGHQEFSLPDIACAMALSGLVADALDLAESLSYDVARAAAISCIAEAITR